MERGTAFIFALFSFFLIQTNTAFSGEVLELKAGTVKLPDLSSQLLNQTLSEKSAQPKYFVVQFKQPVAEIDRNNLISQGAEIKRYLPQDALLVKANPASVGWLGSTNDRVRAVSPFYPQWKISPEFWSEENSTLEAVVISTFDEASLAKVASELHGKILGGGHLFAQIRVMDLNRVASMEGVEWIQKAPLFQTFDFVVDERDLVGGRDATSPAYTGYESGTKVMNFEAAWSRGFHGDGQVVAIADTGVDTGDVSTLHQDLRTNVTKGYVMGLGGESWSDPHGHGTHVAGSIVGNGTRSDGHIRGGAYTAHLVAEGMWSPLLDNLGVETNFERLMGSPYQDGARIHSNSWGSPRNLGDYDSFAANVDEFMWNHPDMLVLFAAGNEGQDADRDGRIDEGSLSSPGTAKNVLTVGASENYFLDGGIQKKLSELRDGNKKWGVEPLASDRVSDNPNGIAAFSSRGPTSDGRLKPEIVAPGTNIVSTRNQNPNTNKLWGEYNANYLYSGGTSMATPLTAGAAAVAREFLVRGRGISNPSAALLKAVLMHTAKDLYPGQYGTGAKQELPTKRPNVHEGYGRIDMDHATALGDETLLIDDTVGVGLSESKATTVPVSAGSGLLATLVYTDAPATAAAAKALVNDLDLQIISPSGKTYQLNDHVNNSEMLQLSQLEAGDYRVVVKGTNVPEGKNGKQPYALVISRQ
jgi:subtilisin family serine protease